MSKQIENEQSPFQRAVVEGLVENKSTVSTSKRRGGPNVGEAHTWIPVFLDALAEGHSITGAAHEANVHPTLVHRRRKEDEEFRKAWGEAAELGTKLMEQEAARRAFHGTLKPVYQQGACVGHIREFSDTLMIFLLKARRPEKYRDGIDDNKRGDTVINILIEDKKPDEPKEVVAEPELIPIEVVTVGEGSK
jgi:hypothetical protein